MFTRSIFVLTILALLCLLAGCSKEAELTPEQQTFVTQTESSFSKLKGEAEKLVAEAKEKATSAEVDAALKSMESAIAETRKVIDALRKEDGQTFEQKKNAVEQALRALGTKVADAAAKVRTSGFNLPGLGG